MAVAIGKVAGAIDVAGAKAPFGVMQTYVWYGWFEIENGYVWNTIQY